MDALINALNDINKDIKIKGTMKERRKRRSAKDIEESILDAANQLIENDGFSKLTVTGIIHLAEIEPVQFYHRYEDLNKFIDEYVKSTITGSMIS